ncbi:MAG: beta-N-acetylhexosaminidase [Actinomycetota bacterium]|nr:beta-N-acetylhexosaminidase [Actinomycetota bacterium]
MNERECILQRSGVEPGITDEHMPRRRGAARRRDSARNAAVVVALAGLLAVAAALAQAPASGAETASALEALTPRQLAGQRVVYSYHGLTPPAELLDAIRRGEAGGVIFFGENIASRDQIRGVVADLQQANAQSPVNAPLLMMTDQEGGIVRRLPGQPVLSAKQIGESPYGKAQAWLAGWGAGLNLKGVGMNVNLAPVLGVFRQPGNFLDRFGRSFGMDPQKVALLGREFVTGQQFTGVAATAKHFPGLGAAAANQDTDAGPVTLDLSLDTLRTVDEVPYPPAIAAGVQLVMPSWAVYPALDPARPAGLSRRVIQDELRGRLGFRGVTITDALEAGALQAFGSPPERAVLAAEAGADLLMFAARDVSLGTAGVGALAAALESGRLERAAFTQAVARILDLRTRLGSNLPLQPPSH